MINRRKGREAGMQILYAVEVGGQAFEAAARDLSEDPDTPIPTDVLDYGKKIARHVLDHRGDIEARISECADHYSLERLAVVDKLVLSAAVAELMYFPDVPVKVAINEAIDIAKKYSTGESSRFVNGVLDAVAKKLQQPPLRKDGHAS